MCPLTRQMMDKSKEAQTNALNDLQQELKSLKSLLNARRLGASTSVASPESPSSSSSIPTSRFGTSSGLGSRPPGIPAWQLAQSSGAPASSSTPAAEAKPADAKPVEASVPAASESAAATESVQ